MYINDSETEIGILLNEFSEASQNSNFFIFFGAGFSKWLGSMTWDEYSNEMIDYLLHLPELRIHDSFGEIREFLEDIKSRHMDNRQKFSIILALVRNEKFDKKPYFFDIDKINKLIFLKESEQYITQISKANLVRKMMMQNIVKITTNYDNFLQALSINNNIEPYNLLDEERSGSYKKRNINLYYLHGFAKDGYKKMMVDTEQYIENYHNGSDTKLEREIEKLLISNDFKQKKIFLFIGYALSELEIMRIYRSKKTIMDEANVIPYALLPVKNEFEYKLLSKYYFSEYNIKIIGYNNSDGNYFLFEKILIKIVDYLDENRPSSTILDEIEKLDI